MTSDLDDACTTVGDLVTEYLEHALPSDQQLVFETHVVYCAGCSAFLEQVRTIADALRSLPPVAIALDERTRLVEAWEGRT